MVSCCRWAVMTGPECDIALAATSMLGTVARYQPEFLESSECPGCGGSGQRCFGGYRVVMIAVT